MTEILLGNYFEDWNVFVASNKDYFEEGKINIDNKILSVLFTNT